MRAYHGQLWYKILPVLQAEEVRTAALNTHLEATTLAKQQRLASHHTADTASKSLASAIALRRHAWLWSARINDNARARIEDLSFDGVGLFNEKADKVMENLHKMRKTAHSYSIQQPRYQCNQWHKLFTFHQSYQHPYPPYKPQAQAPERSNFSQLSSSAPPFRCQAPAQRRQGFCRPTKKYI